MIWLSVTNFVVGGVLGIIFGWAVTCLAFYVRLEGCKANLGKLLIRYDTMMVNRNAAISRSLDLAEKVDRLDRECLSLHKAGCDESERATMLANKLTRVQKISSVASDDYGHHAAIVEIINGETYGN